jgi:hypothetical protein
MLFCDKLYAFLLKKLERVMKSREACTICSLNFGALYRQYVIKVRAYLYI